VVTLQDAPVDIDETELSGAEHPERPGRYARTGRSRVTLVAGAVLLATVAAAAGWLVPRLAAPGQPSYLGTDASVVAKAMGCTGYTRASRHDESVYRYRDQGTCVLDGTIVTITTFDRASDGDAFASVMKAVIPILHPTWVGATYAAGTGWNVADARNLTASAAELAVQRLGAGATYTIPATR
jgi:hypothetical protein